MKITITSVYDGVDEEFLAWYKQDLLKRSPPEMIKTAQAFSKNNYAVFESKDPEGITTGTTIYQVIWDENHQ